MGGSIPIAICSTFGTLSLNTCQGVAISDISIYPKEYLILRLMDNSINDIFGIMWEDSNLLPCCNIDDILFTGLVCYRTVVVISCRNTWWQRSSVGLQLATINLIFSSFWSINLSTPRVSGLRYGKDGSREESEAAGFFVFLQ